MQYYWIRQGQGNRLHVVVLGWACGAEILAQARLEESEWDVLCLYQYNDLSLDIDFSAYTNIRLTAWSFGVWVAQYLFGGDTRVTSATAINGTPRPVDEQFGIHPKAFALTVRGIERVGIDRFMEQMCGNRVQEYRGVAKLRPIEILSHELKFLGESFQTIPTSPIRWTEAVVGMSDTIFPPKAMLNFWQTISPATKVQIIDNMAHLWMPTDKF